MNRSKTPEVPSSSSFVFASPVAAYIRSIETEHGTAFGVFDAHGNPLATFASQDAAFFAARQNDLEPTLVH